MKKSILLILLVCMLFANIFSQQTNKQESIIFGLVFEGDSLDPIAYVKKNKLVSIEEENGFAEPRKALVKDFYQIGMKYSLIFGGVENGKVAINDNHEGDCSGNSANVEINSKVKLSQTSPALATNIKSPKSSNSFRRLLTTSEKTEVGKLVKAEYAKHKVIGKKLKIINLTAIDYNNDDVPEFVGSYSAVTSKLSRGLLFFIAEKTKNGKYKITKRDYEKISQENVMSGEIKDLDEGFYHDILLDAFDFDKDGKKEIFTVSYAFEANSYFVYKKVNDSWEKVFETDSYRCGY